MEEAGFFGGLFEPIENLLSFVLNILYAFTDKLGFGSYGLAIILLTIIIKIALYPLTVKQLQEKFKDKPQMLQQKMMEMYQREGVNPLAGCLPLLIQMPILMAMYYALYNFDYGEVAPSFLWIPSLSEPDPIYILPLLSAFTTFLQQKMSMTELTPQTKIMMVMMPLFIGWISLNFPAGLVLYWTTMNVVQIIQQFWVYRKSDKEAA